MTTAHMNRKLVGTVFALLAAGGYAFLPIFGKFAYQAGGLGALDISAWRFTSASALIWLMWPLWRQRNPVRAFSRRQVAIMLGLGALYALISLLGFLALNYLPAATYSLIFYTYPAMVALMSLLAGEPLRPVGWAAVGLALVGCALTVQGRLQVTSGLGLLFVLLNALTYAAYLVLARHHTRETSRLASGAMMIAATMLTLLLVSAAAGLHLPQSPRGWLALIGLGAVSTVLANLTMLVAMSYLGASNAAIVSTVEPAITVVLAALLLGERIAALQILGGALIVASVLLLHASPRSMLSPAPDIEPSSRR